MMSFVCQAVHSSLAPLGANAAVSVPFAASIVTVLRPERGIWSAATWSGDQDAPGLRATIVRRVISHIEVFA
jgi:hypothetical protein